MPIEQLGPYRVEKVLGRGGMGAVYSAVHETTGDRVAVKILAESLADDPNFRERFGTEIETLKTLKHRNIVELVGYGEQDGLLFYAMELVDGKSLQDELNAGRLFDWREVTQIGIQVCAALKHAHDHGVIHRDLKPANLMYTDGSHIKLSDFGIAKLFGATQVTAIGGVIGTADYMSPEQAEGKSVTARSDLYSLGSVLYALLAKKPPFASKSIAAVIHGLRFDKPVPIRQLVPETPDELENIVMQLLEKDPSKRIATARAVGNRLKAMEHALSLETRVDESLSSPAAPDPFGDLDALDATIASHAPRSPQSTKHSTGEMPTSALGDVTNLPPWDAGATRGKATLDASGLDDLTDYELAIEPAKPSTVVAQTRFTHVSDEERRRPRVFTSANDNDGLWIKVASFTGMALVLMLTLVVGWWMMRPDSANGLYSAISAAASADDPSDIVRVETEIDEFLNRFPDDPRAAEVSELRKDMAIYHMKRKLERRAARAGGADFLSPIEQAFLSATRVRTSSIELARQRLEHLVHVFGPLPDPSDEDAEIVALARHELERLNNTEVAPAADHSGSLLELIDWADKNLKGQELAEFRAGVVALYADKAWAADVVRELRDADSP